MLSLPCIYAKAESINFSVLKKKQIPSTRINNFKNEIILFHF